MAVLSQVCRVTPLAFCYSCAVTLLQWSQPGRRLCGGYAGQTKRQRLPLRGALAKSPPICGGESGQPTASKSVVEIPASPAKAGRW